MARLTQHQRIIELCAGERWVCVKDFHPITWYPWKRRAEISEKGKYFFKSRKCEHGISGADDWMMIELKQESTQKTPEPTQNINESTQRSQ